MDFDQIAEMCKKGDKTRMAFRNSEHVLFNITF